MDGQVPKKTTETIPNQPERMSFRDAMRDARNRTSLEWKEELFASAVVVSLTALLRDWSDTVSDAIAIGIALFAGLIVIPLVRFLGHLVLAPYRDAWKRIDALSLLLLSLEHERDAWRDRSSEAEKSGLRIQIERLATGSLTEPIPPGQATIVVLYVRVVNGGRPTTTMRWRAGYYRDGKVVKLALIDKDFTVSQPAGQIELLDSNSIYNRTSHVPIPTGGSETGHIVGIALGASESDVKREGNQFIVACNDAYGNFSEGVFDVRDSNPRHRPLDEIQGWR